MTSLDLLKWMLARQGALNAMTNAKDVAALTAATGSPATWCNLRRRWHTAIAQEGAEILDRLPWKWWKAPPAPDLTQIKIELVDVGHFLLSWCLNDSYNVEGILIAFDKARAAPVMEQQLAVERLIHAASGGAQNYNEAKDAFAVCCVAFDLDLPEFHRLYAGKNLLNGFRQEHGYSTGSYRKHWYDGREDNEHLADVLAGVQDAESADDFAAAIVQGLAGRYAMRPEAAAA